jgi:predicted membrane channel-forming protein YqfA (hemolysin III family)
MLSASWSEKRLRFAGICLAIGLLIEALCLIWATPIAFIVFVAIGGLLMLIGLVVYVHSQVSSPVASD